MKGQRGGGWVDVRAIIAVLGLAVVLVQALQAQAETPQNWSWAIRGIIRALQLNSPGVLKLNESVDEDLYQRLVGQWLPSVRLSSTAGGIVDPAAPSTGRTVIYCYPRTSEPGKPAPTDWDLIPGARGCTPQACTFRDHYQQLRALGAEVFGLSTQTTAYQAEMSARLHLPFAVLSDHAMHFTMHCTCRPSWSMGCD
jgi:peroxiredoxin